MSDYAAPLPRIPGDMPIREVLFLSQTNVTEDPFIGLHYATTAYDRALDPDIAAADPTAAGEAAAKAGFRTAQAHMPYRQMVEWFKRSHEALSGEDQISSRHRAATYLLEGRSHALVYVRDKTTTQYAYSSVADNAREAFQKGEELLEDPRDAYAPMLYGHWATFEAMNNDGKQISPFPIAFKGLKSAIRAREENANTPDRQLNTKERLIKNGSFMLKQSRRSLAAMALGATRPLATIKKVHKVRRNIALKTLG